MARPSLTVDSPCDPKTSRASYSVQRCPPADTNAQRPPSRSQTTRFTSLGMCRPSGPSVKQSVPERIAARFRGLAVLPSFALSTVARSSRQRPLEDETRIAARDLTPQQSLDPSQFLVGLRPDRELHAVALGGRRLDDRTRRGTSHESGNRSLGGAGTAGVSASCLGRVMADGGCAWAADGTWGVRTGTLRTEGVTSCCGANSATRRSMSDRVRFMARASPESHVLRRQVRTDATDCRQRQRSRGQQVQDPREAAARGDGREPRAGGVLGEAQRPCAVREQRPIALRGVHVGPHVERGQVGHQLGGGAALVRGDLWEARQQIAVGERGG